MAPEDAIAKARRESLDLRLNAVRHVDPAIEWNMAIRPERMASARRTRFVKKTLLCDEDKRALRNFSERNVALCRGNLVECSSEVNCAGATTSFGFPRDWFAEGIIDLENSRRVAKRLQTAAMP